MSSGAKVISAFIRETVAGTTPASGDWSLLKRTSWGVKPTQNKGENNEIGGSRMAQGATPGTVDVGGDVGTKFRWGQHDDFLASCFGAEWSGDSLTMGNERITFSLATYASDVGIASVVRGAQVGSWKMQIPNDGDITATVLVLIRTPLRLVHMDIPSPLTLLVTRKTPSKTSHLTIL